MRVGLAAHPLRPEALGLARRAAEVLASHGVEPLEVGLDTPDREALAAEVVAGLDLIIGLGGDGTFLRTAHLARDYGVPVLGVNVGRLGFLAEVEADALDAALAAVASGRTHLVERATLEVEVLDGPGTVVATDWALNEVAIEKASRQRLVRLELELDRVPFTTVAADALIVATSTGSTAYALSAGGPIVSPLVEATLIVPVAPHSLFDRTLVTGPREPVVVALAQDQRPAVVTCDGRAPMRLEPGGRVRVVGGGRPVLLATIADPAFFPRVRRKFGLP
jgi:NAD+ kinase